MKIGLICNYYIYNYGSVLQSYALQSVLKKEGINVTTIQYCDNPSKKNKAIIFLRLKAKNVLNIRHFYRKVQKKLMAKADSDYSTICVKRKEKYDEFVRKNFSLTNKFNSVQEVKEYVSTLDCVVLSSDQLWGPEDLIRGYHTLEFIPSGINKIAYATSFGVSTVPKFLNSTIKTFIPKIHHVSVREESGRKIISSLCGRDVPVVLDPTLLLDAEEWHRVAGENKLVKDDYIFCYFLGENVNNFECARMTAKGLNCKSVSILHPEAYNSTDERFADVYIDAVGPQEFLNLIYNAKYVITDSFHASIFSIHFRKKFVVFDRYVSSSSMSRNTRIENLLKMTGLTSRHVKNIDSSVQQQIESDIEWECVIDKLTVERKASLDYLRSSLKGKE